MTTQKSTSKQRLPSEKKVPNLFSRLWFCWMFPMFYNGNRRDLDEYDLQPARKMYDSKSAGDKLERNWLAEERDAKASGRKPSFTMVLVRTFGWSFVPGGLMQLLNVILRTLSPLLFAQLLSFWSADSTMDRTTATYFGLSMIVTNWFAAFFNHHGNLFCQQFGMKLRIATSSLMFRKIMRMNNGSLGETTAGKVVNILSNDLQRFDLAFLFMHYIWIIPIQMIAVCYLGFMQAGYAALIGIVALILIALPIQGVLGRVSGKVRFRVAEKTDDRIKVMSEVINGIQVIKMYAWEIPFQKVVGEKRLAELRWVNTATILRTVFLGFMVFTERTALFIAILTYVLLGNSMSANIIYPLQQFMNAAQINITLILPLVISFTSELFVSLRRVQEFLILDDRPDLLSSWAFDTNLFRNMSSFRAKEKASIRPLSYQPKTDTYLSNGTPEIDVKNRRERFTRSLSFPGEVAVELQNITASWTNDPNFLALKNLSLRIRKGRLCAVIGAVGSGKSSLLQLLLKELPAMSGSVSVHGKVSYACQEAWLFPSTVRENILFGQPYDAEKYKKVCRTCALEKDFKQFPYGDQTLVGERGVSLSGGQRARINLARAVYREADIYLLDDPLSAVDANVGRQLFEGCINGYLRSHTRILVTHQIHFLKAADYIIVLNSRVQTDRAWLASPAREPVARPVWTALGLPRAHVGSAERRSTPSHALSVFADAQRRLSLSCSPSVDGRYDTREPIANNTWFSIVIRRETEMLKSAHLGSRARLRTFYKWLGCHGSRSDRPSAARDPRSVGLDAANEGGVENMGTFDELVSTGKEFATMLAALQEGKDKDSDSLSSAGSTDSKDKKVLTRTKSVSESEKEPEFEAQKMKAEERQSGNLRWAVVSAYFRSGGNWCFVLFTMFMVLIAAASAAGADFWVSYWSNRMAEYEEAMAGEPIDPGLDVVVGMFTTGQYLIIHGCIVLSCILLTQLRAIPFVNLCVTASNNLHNSMFSNMLRGIMRFFDTSSSGRILNRFTKDMGALDEILPRTLLDVLQIYSTLVAILVLNALSLYFTLIPSAVLLILFFLFVKVYLKMAQAIKRLEGTTKSPVFGMVTSSLNGMATIRSCGAQDRLISEFDTHQNLHTSAWNGYLCGGATFALYLDTMCLIYLGTIIFVFLYLDFGNLVAVGSVGLAVTQSNTLTAMLQHGARMLVEFIAQLTSVERVLEYTNIENEPNLFEGQISTPPTWPSEGRIVFQDVNMRYAPEEPPVLKNLNLTFDSGWKVGIVGRTGAGKSSLISAMFRFAYIEGKISIDGIDTSLVSRQGLRSKISIIPQEPVLFSATIRYNLDPFNIYSDDDLWRALEQVDMKSAVPSLDFKVTEGGSNFSVGQRQLMCLARAVLRSNKILIMDEATANVDPATDNFIQQTIRRQFASCTVLTIAHRLNTIMDSDRVLVMSSGQVAEFDHPYILLSDPNSAFSSMLRETGEKNAATLINVAKDAYFKSNLKEHGERIDR